MSLFNFSTWGFIFLSPKACIFVIFFLSFFFFKKLYVLDHLALLWIGAHLKTVNNIPTFFRNGQSCMKSKAKHSFYPGCTSTHANKERESRYTCELTSNFSKLCKIYYCLIWGKGDSDQRVHVGECLTLQLLIKRFNARQAQCNRIFICTVKHTVREKMKKLNY